MFLLIICVIFLRQKYKKLIFLGLLTTLTTKMFSTIDDQIKNQKILDEYRELHRLAKIIKEVGLFEFMLALQALLHGCSMTKHKIRTYLKTMKKHIWGDPDNPICDTTTSCPEYLCGLMLWLEINYTWQCVDIPMNNHIAQMMQLAKDADMQNRIYYKDHASHKKINIYLKYIKIKLNVPHSDKITQTQRIFHFADSKWSNHIMEHFQMTYKTLHASNNKNAWRELESFRDQCAHILNLLTSGKKEEYLEQVMYMCKYYEHKIHTQTSESEHFNATSNVKDEIPQSAICHAATNLSVAQWMADLQSTILELKSEGHITYLSELVQKTLEKPPWEIAELNLFKQLNEAVKQNVVDANYEEAFRCTTGMITEYKKYVKYSKQILNGA